MGATTGSSHTGDAPSIRWCTTMRYGTATAATRPIRVPAANRTASSAMAAGSPVQSRPTTRAPPPTASSAIDRQP